MMQQPKLTSYRKKKKRERKPDTKNKRAGLVKNPASMQNTNLQKIANEAWK